MTPENLFINDILMLKKHHQGHSNPFSEPSAHTFMVPIDIIPHRCLNASTAKTCWFFLQLKRYPKYLGLYLLKAPPHLHASVDSRPLASL